MEIERVTRFKHSYTLKLLIICWIFSTFNYSTFAQGFSKTFVELKYAVGGTTFLGDLGGTIGRGKRGVFDLDISSMGAHAAFGVKVNFSKQISCRVEASYGQLYANDAYSGDITRNLRNLHFKSDLYELTLVGVFPVYDFANLSKKKGKGISEVYCFAGFGVFRYNPMAEYNGTWYELRPLSTEGQGFVAGSEPYSLIQAVIPMGIGFSKNIGKRISIGFELSFRKSFTDYIDDVSDKYPDPEELRLRKGDVAVALSNRHLDNGGRIGSQRGNPNNNDNYSFIQITFNQSFGRKKAKTFNLKSLFQRVDVCPDF